MQTINLLNAIEEQTAALPPASPAHNLKANALIVLKRVACFTAAGLVGWGIAYAAHAASHWTQTPVADGVAGIGTIFRRFVDFISGALY